MLNIITAAPRMSEWVRKARISLLPKWREKVSVHLIVPEGQQGTWIRILKNDQERSVPPCGMAVPDEVKFSVHTGLSLND